MTHIIAEPCVGVKDAACVEVCPVDCIHTNDSSNQYFIHPDECIDCGACVPVCPAKDADGNVGAIFAEEDLPAKWASYKEINANFPFP